MLTWRLLHHPQQAARQLPARTEQLQIHDLHNIYGEMGPGFRCGDIEGCSNAARSTGQARPDSGTGRSHASSHPPIHIRPPSLTIHWLLPVPLLCCRITSVHARPSAASRLAARARCQLSTLCTRWSRQRRRAHQRTNYCCHGMLGQDYAHASGYDAAMQHTLWCSCLLPLPNNSAAVHMQQPVPGV